MCLAIPGKVLEIEGSDCTRAGKVQFGVHVGFAISIVESTEAERTYELLESMGVMEIDPPVEAS